MKAVTASRLHGKYRDGGERSGGWKGDEMTFMMAVDSGDVVRR